jgi:hypothetical protein
MTITPRQERAEEQAEMLRLVAAMSEAEKVAVEILNDSGASRSAILAVLEQARARGLQLVAIPKRGQGR